jgi:hypothetical protein
MPTKEEHTMELVRTAQSLTQYLGETDADYQEATTPAQIARLTRGASEVVGATFPEGHVTDLYYAFGEVSDAMSAAAWAFRDKAPADDHWELVIQSHVHTFAAELTRVLNANGIPGTVVADSLDDILNPSELATH